MKKVLLVAPFYWWYHWVGRSRLYILTLLIWDQTSICLYPLHSYVIQHCGIASQARGIIGSHITTYHCVTLGKLFSLSVPAICFPVNGSEVAVKKSKYLAYSKYSINASCYYQEPIQTKVALLDAQQNQLINSAILNFSVCRLWVW